MYRCTSFLQTPKHTNSIRSVSNFYLSFYQSIKREREQQYITTKNLMKSQERMMKNSMLQRGAMIKMLLGQSYQLIQSKKWAGLDANPQQ